MREDIYHHHSGMCHLSAFLFHETNALVFHVTYDIYSVLRFLSSYMLMLVSHFLIFLLLVTLSGICCPSSWTSFSTVIDHLYLKHVKSNCKQTLKSQVAGSGAIFSVESECCESGSESPPLPQLEMFCPLFSHTVYILTIAPC